MHGYDPICFFCLSRVETANAQVPTPFLLSSLWSLKRFFPNSSHVLFLYKRVDRTRTVFFSFLLAFEGLVRALAGVPFIFLCLNRTSTRVACRRFQFGRDFCHVAAGFTPSPLITCFPVPNLREFPAWIFFPFFSFYSPFIYFPLMSYLILSLSSSQFHSPSPLF